MRTTWFKGAALAVVFVVLGATVAWADNVDVSGDDVVMVGSTPTLDLGVVCADDAPISNDVSVAAKRNGNYGNPQVWANEATITFAVNSVSDAGLSASMDDSPSQVVLSADWDDTGNNELSTSKGASVTFDPGALGSFTGTVVFRGSGEGSAGGTQTVTRDVSVTVTAEVEECDENSAPTVETAAPDATGNEGSALTTGGSFADADLDALEITKLSGEGDVTDLGGGSWSWTHSPTDNGSGSVTVRASDGDLTATDTFSWSAANVAPTATINGAPGESPEGTEISLTGGVSDPGADDTHTYSWSVTKGGSPFASGSNQNFSFTPDDNASYVVTFTATDDDGGADSDEATITVTNVAPSGTIGASPMNINEGGSTTLSISSPADASSVDASTLRYQFACTGALPAPSFAAASPTASTTCSFDDGPATETLRARVIDKDGGYRDYETTVGVANVNPTATFNAPATVNEGDPFNVSHTGITDPSTTDAGSLEHAFDCGDGGGFATYGSATSRNCTTSDDGDLSVGGKVRDKDGGESTYGATVTVLNVNPTATIGGEPVTSPEGTLISLTGGVSDPGADTHTFAWSVTKNGSPYASGTTQDFSFTPDDNGTYLVSFTATDDDGGTGSDSASITVTNVAPSASITGAPSTSPEGTSISLGHGTVTDPGTADTHSFTWSVTKDGTAYDSGSGHTFSFTPDDNASYVVTMAVTDDDGGSGQDTATIAVTNVDPTLSALGVSGGGGVACASNTATLSFTATDAVGEANDPLAGSIDWGDGGAAQTFAGRSVLETHSFGPGTYTIQVSIEDGDGGTDSEQATFSKLYSTSGFLQPINAAGSRSSFKLGSTIPVKIRIFDCNNQLVTNLTPDVELYRLDTNPDLSVNEVSVDAAATNGKEMRWTGAEYLYNLSTKLSQHTGAPLVAGTYRIKVVDPAISTQSVEIDLRK